MRSVIAKRDPLDAVKDSHRDVWLDELGDDIRQITSIVRARTTITTEGWAHSTHEGHTSSASRSPPIATRRRFHDWLPLSMERCLSSLSASSRCSLPCTTSSRGRHGRHHTGNRAGPHARTMAPAALAADSREAPPSMALPPSLKRAALPKHMAVCRPQTVLVTHDILVKHERLRKPSGLCIAPKYRS